MYKLVIADDEPLIREGLQKIDWKSINIDLYKVCSNGFEVLYALEEEDIDIVLTDIRMPALDGLELIQTISNRYPYIHTLVLSGYDNFDYLRKCMQCGADDYLIKPIKQETIIDAFKGVIEKLNKENHFNTKNDIVTRKQKLSQKYLRRMFLSQLFTRQTEISVIEEGFMHSELSFSKNGMVVFYFKRDLKNITSKEERIKILKSLQTKLEIYFSHKIYGFFYVFKDTCDFIIAYTHTKITEDTEKQLSQVSALKDNVYSIGKLLKSSYSCGISQIIKDLENSYKYVAQVKESLQDMDLSDDIIFIDEPLIISEAIDKKVMEKLTDTERNSYLIELASQYIRDNYTTAITLSDVANHVHLNASYFSTLFKSVTGVNFVKFLSELRMKEAKKLLKNTTHKIYLIGELVGYENPRYFSDVFKKHTGLTPNDYRNNV